jgi:hypothetical protein
MREAPRRVMRELELLSEFPYASSTAGLGLVGRPEELNVPGPRSND